MGKAIKRDWDSDIAYVKNVFAYLLVWINPIRIQAKVEEHTHHSIVNWINFMLDTTMPKALDDFINPEDVWRKIELDTKETTALNIVHEFLKDGHLDEEMQSLIQMNHNFCRFIYSTTIHIICFNTKEIHIQERFLEKHNDRERNAHGGWLNAIPSVDQYNLELAMRRVLQYPALPKESQS